MSTPTHGQHITELISPNCSSVQAWNTPRAPQCDTVEDGYQCRPGISHFWGIWAPYFKVPTEISADVPKGCKVSFVNVLVRHGARNPSLNNTIAYAALIRKIQSTTKAYKGKYRFLKNYQYTLGAEELTKFGEDESYRLGVQAYRRYPQLFKKYTPFIRAAGLNRIVVTAQKFSEAVHNQRVSRLGDDPAAYPYPIEVLSEAPGTNNTYAFPCGPFALPC